MVYGCARAKVPPPCPPRRLALTPCKSTSSPDIRQIHLKEIECNFDKVEKKQGPLKQLIKEDVQKDIQKFKINNMVIEAGQVLEFNSILPEKFFEIPYMSQPRDKKTKLEQLNENLSKICNRGIKINVQKDYSNIYNILTKCIEEPNYLVYSESMRCFISIVKVLRRSIPYNVFKYFVLAIGEKYKGPKDKKYNKQIDQVFDDIVINDAISQQQFIEILMCMAENDKNLHMRIGVISWMSNQYQMIQRHLLSDGVLRSGIQKRITQIMKKETNLRLKDACNIFLVQLQEPQSLLDGADCAAGAMKQQADYGKYFKTMMLDKDKENINLVNECVPNSKTQALAEGVDLLNGNNSSVLLKQAKLDSSQVEN